MSSSGNSGQIRIDVAPSAPRLSIGLPVYNGDAFLAAAIDSLLAQTFTDFELIISDNASTDGTEAICRDRAARDPRVRYIRHDVNRGAMFNFNHVVELARGSYFKWAAHDDVHAPEFLARCVEALDRDPGVVLAFTKLVDIDESGTRIPFLSPALRWDSPHPNVRFRALCNPHHRCESVFGVMRLDALRRSFLISDYAGCDRVLLAQLSLMGRYYEVPEILFLHREHAQRSTMRYKDSKKRTEWFTARPSKPALPHFRMLSGYARAVRKSNAPLMDKLACFAMLVPWTRRNARKMGREMSFAVSYALASRRRRAETDPGLQQAR
jgi:glycosyltransferase involved in cell wall biosynthesis